MSVLRTSMNGHLLISKGANHTHTEFEFEDPFGQDGWHPVG